jgi:hypothetical protein
MFTSRVDRAEKVLLFRAPKPAVEARYAEAKQAARLAASEAKKAAQAVADAERSLAKAKGALET